MTYYVLLLSTFLIVANSFHVFTQWLINKPEEYFIGIAHYFADYFLYVSQIAQKTPILSGYTQHLFTNEPLAPTWIYWFNSLLGKLQLLNVNPFAIYNISLIVVAAALLYLLWKTITLVFPKNPTHQMIAFLFVTTASNFTNTSIQLIADFWFSPTLALNRLGGVPHQMMQTILFISVLIVYTKLLVLYDHKEKNVSIFRKPSTYLLLFVSFLAATANPIQMLLLTISLVLTTFVSTNSLKLNNEKIKLSALVATSSLMGALLTNAEFTHQPILTAARLWENGQQLSINPFQFLLALGPIALFLPFGIKRYIKHLSPIRWAFGWYGTLSLIFFFSPLPSLLHTTSVRWLSPASYLILPLLATEGLIMLSQGFYRYTKPQLSVPCWIAGLLFIYIFLTIPSLYTQVKARTIPFNSDSTLKLINHVPKPVVEALFWLQTKQNNTLPVVLMNPALPYDVLIPVFTGMKSFTGHPIHTLYPSTKEALRKKFFSLSMSKQEAQQFLKDHTILYIITSSPTAPNFSSYVFLSQSFENAMMTIYTVKF